MMNRIKSNVYRLLTTAAICFAVGACSSDEGDSMPQVPANPDALCAITPHAIEISPVDASTTPITRSATGEPEQKATYAENLGHNYSAEATLEAVPQEAQTRAATNLAAGAQYRIVVFDSSGAIVGNVVYKQGSTAVVSGNAIKLKAGTYRLFAYTFNSTSAIRGLDADNRNVTVNNGGDFMTYTNTAFTISSTDYGSGKQLNISFTRQCARLTVRIIVEGYDDNTVTVANLNIGNVFGLSKWDGTMNTDASTLPTVAGESFIAKVSDDASIVDCGALGVSCLFSRPFTDQYISVSDLYLIIQGVGVKRFSDFTFPNPVTLVKGGSYRLTIHTGNYYVLTRTNPVTIGGVKWARTNLQQTGSGVTAPVSFVGNPWDYGSYWNWGMRDATIWGSGGYNLQAPWWNISTPGHANQDPCRSLGSGWRLPSKDELNSLVNNPVPSGTKVRINGVINTIGSYGWAPDAKGLVCISGYEVVFLPGAGSYNTNDGSFYGEYSWYCANSALLEDTYGLYLFECIRFAHDMLDTYVYLYAAIPLRCVQD